MVTLPTAPEKRMQQQIAMPSTFSRLLIAAVALAACAREPAYYPVTELVQKRCGGSIASSRDGAPKDVCSALQACDGPLWLAVGRNGYAVRSDRGAWEWEYWYGPDGKLVGGVFLGEGDDGYVREGPRLILESPVFCLFCGPTPEWGYLANRCTQTRIGALPK
jgi:hypothetical protein